jgi:hypothetical protein
MALIAVLFCGCLAACGGSAKNTANARGVSTSGTVKPPASSLSTTSAESATPEPGSTPTNAKESSSDASTSNAAPTGDQDGDSSNNLAFDKDDSFITTFGHAADASDRRTITTLVERYYAALAKADGATACSLLFVVIAESAAETYGQTGSDPTAGRRETCSSVLSRLFKGDQPRFQAEYRNLKVIMVRVQRKRAFVLLRFGPQSVRRIIVYREGSSWKIGELLDTELV